MTACTCGHPVDDHDDVGCCHKPCPCLIPYEELKEKEEK